MRLPPTRLVLAACLAGSTACAPAAITAPVQPLPPGASGKIGADQVGKTSPVPAFRALGEAWRMDAEGSAGLRLSARLHRDAPPRDAEATLVYRFEGATRDRHPLSGVLHADGGDRAIEVVLVRGDCEAGDGAHAWTIQVRIEGEAMLLGCADVAM